MSLLLAPTRTILPLAKTTSAHDLGSLHAVDETRGGRRGRGRGRGLRGVARPPAAPAPAPGCCCFFLALALALCTKLGSLLGILRVCVLK